MLHKLSSNSIMSTTEIKLCDILRKNLNRDDGRAKVFTEVFYKSIEDQTNKTATEYKSDFKLDLQRLELSMTTLVKDSKTETIKWVFAFFVTLMLMVLGLYATILLK